MTCRRLVVLQCALTRASLMLLLCALMLAAGPAWAEETVDGKRIYQQQCAMCHGANGEGVTDINENPLHGTKSLAELSKLIDETMPEDEPELCTGEQAESVAQYIYSTFYSPAARERMPTARIELVRLTNRQYLNSTADLLASFRGSTRPDERRGLNAQYFKSRNFGRGDRVIERVDPAVSFDFGEGSPDKQVPNPAEFSIQWTGSLLADEAGDYEFIVKTENGVRLWINDDQTPLIDQWVASAGRDQEHTATIRLLGGRAYPIRLDVFKYKGNTASISLEWKPPHKARTVIPQRNLSPARVPSTFVAATPFPPDDRVSGYERGTSVSKEWDAATTQAAIEMANEVVERLGELSRNVGGNNDPTDRAKRLCYQLAERAFRRPMTDEQKRFFVDMHFADGVGVESAVKRSVLLVLKSPRFLYVDFGQTSPDQFEVATRLSYALWDSLPDQTLTQAAAAGNLKTREQVAAQANRMLADPRAKAKLQYFLHDWLQIDEKEELAKDEELFPEFDDLVAADLRTSLDLFLDEVVWSEPSDFRQLFLADYVFLNSRLAKVYGVDAPADDGFQKVALDADRRAGVVTHPYLMATHAYHNLSSPIHRGVFVTRRLLGQTLKPPPQATEFKDEQFHAQMTTREKVTSLTSAAACQSCHVVINPLGFSLEHFDAVGRFRELELDKPIDASSVFTTVDGQSVPLSGARDLANLIVSSNQAHGAFVDQLFHQAIKQPINSYGPQTRDKLIESFVQSDFNIRKLLVEIATLAVLHNSSSSAENQ